MAVAMGEAVTILGEQEVEETAGGAAVVVAMGEVAMAQVVSEEEVTAVVTTAAAVTEAATAEVVMAAAAKVAEARVAMVGRTEEQSSQAPTAVCVEAASWVEQKVAG